MIALWRNNLWLRRLVMWVLIPIAAIYLWWQWMYPVAQFRYKLTVEVMTPDGLKTGSSVIEVRYSSGHPLPNPGRACNDRVIAGEAVYVDLGRGKNLFVLLSNILSGRNYKNEFGIHGESYTPLSCDETNGYGANTRESLVALSLPKYVFQLQRKAGEESVIVAKLAERRKQPAVHLQNLNALPTLVAFDDLSRKQTARIVQPENLEVTYGAGYVLKNAMLELTDEAVSDSILHTLPWLPELPSNMLEADKYGTLLVDKLEYRSFKQPNKKSK